MIVKVTIAKTHTNEGKQTNFSYPVGYDTKVHSPFMYQNEGKDTELCLANCPDGTKLSEGIEEVSKEDAEKLIEAWAESDKDAKEAEGKTLAETKAANVLKRKAWLES